MVLLAFSLQDQVDKYGVWIGIAAFLGLAVLSLLYFAQARELKRLRDWAGRAPERARELEDRVTASAQQAQAPRRVTPMPPRQAPPAAATAAAAGGTAAAVAAPPKPPVEKAGLAEGNGSGDGLPDAAPEPAASAPGAGGKKPEEEKAAGEGEKPAEEDGEQKPAAVAAGADAPAKPPGDQAGEGAEKPPAAAAVGEAGEAAPEEKDPAGTSNGSGDPAAAPGPAVPRPSTAAASGAAMGAGAASKPPASSPPAKPAPQRQPAAALRSSAPSATPGKRRTTTLPPRRPAPPPPPPEPESRSRGRWAVFGGVVAVLLAGAVFVYIQSTSNEKPPSSANQAATPTPSATPDGDGDSGSAPTSRASTTVAVFNGTTQTGLAGSVADKVQAGGFKRGSTGNDTNQQRSTSLVYFTAEARSQGREVAKLLNISEIRPIDSEIQALAGGNADVVVVAGLDQAP